MKEKRGQRYSNYYRPFKGYDLFHDFVTSEGKELRFTPRQFLEALNDASNEMSYSNYHTDKFERISEIIRRYCNEHKISLGRSQKQYEYIKKIKHKAFIRKSKKYKNNPAKLLKLIENAIN